jgi:hypothetical protein
MQKYVTVKLYNVEQFVAVALQFSGGMASINVFEDGGKLSWEGHV